MNIVTLTGRIASDIELKYTPKGDAMSKFRVAVRDPFRKGDDGKPTADFFDVVAWRNSAEFAANYLQKGSGVAISGRLKVEEWKNDEGQKRSRVVINANDVEGYGESKGGGQPQPEAKKAAPPPPVEEPEFDPFADEV